MKLQTYCKSCRKPFTIKSNAESRPELEDHIGEYFNYNCPNCLKNNEYHVNDVFANINQTGKYFGYAFGLIVMLGVTSFAWENGYITTIGLLIGGLIILTFSKTEHNSSTRAFNKYKTKRSRKSKRSS